MKNRIVLIATLLFTGICAHTQSVLITDPDYDQANPLDCNVFNDGSIQNFFDSGNNTADYSPNENDTIVICPDLTNGSKVTIAFATNAGYTWSVDPTDTVYVYDGPNTASPLLGAINSSTHPNGATFQASFQNNPSGCLTVVFISDGASESTGWDGNVTCGNPPQPFEAHMVAYINGDIAGGNDMAPVDTGYVDVCPGDSIMFVATPLFPYDSSITLTGYDQINNHDVEWAFSEGTILTGDTVWFTPPAQQGYLVTLTVSDHFPQSEFLIGKIRVSTTPDFSTCMPVDDTLCLGDYTTLIGGITAQDTAGVDPTQASIIIGGTFAGLTYLPDGSGQVYTTDVQISGFPIGTTIQNATDIKNVCITIEHSYLGDLEMELECPNGSSVAIFDSYGPGGLLPNGFNGGGTFLGEAYDNNIGNPGIGWEYCFYDGAPNSAWAIGYPTTPVVSPPSPANGTAVTAGDYEPEVSFGALAGCPINGTWTITVQDNLGIDDGYIFEWGICFDPALNPNTETYTPFIVSENWLSNPDLSGGTDTVVVAEPSSLGDNFYTFEVTDNFGCTYDTTINVYAIAGASIMPDTLACNNTMFVNSTVSAEGGVWAQVQGPGNSNFSSSNTDDNPTITVTQDGLYVYSYIGAQCNDTSYVQIFFLPDPSVTLMDTLICDGDVYVMDATYPNGTYQWFYNGTPLVGATGPTYGASAAGFYSVAVQSTCGAASDQAEVELDPCIINVPNVFTPNNDGVNDVFEIEGLMIYRDTYLQIYNRWGGLVYEKANYQNDWDGTAPSGNKLSDGTYFYLLTATRPFSGEIQKYQGHVNIFDNN